MIVNATLDITEASRRIWDVVAIGAGPAGSLAARELARRGATTLLVDKASFPHYKVCGCCLNERALAALDAVGLAGLVDRHGGMTIRQLRIGASGCRITLPIGGRSLSRAVFDAALVAEAIGSGAHFLPGALARLGPATESTRTVLLHKDGRDIAISARVVLGADGLGGRQLAGDVKHRSVVDSGSRLGAGVISADFPEFFEAGSIFMACGQGGYVGLVRLEDGKLDIAAAFDRALVKQTGSLGKAAAVILGAGGFPPIRGLESLPWHGTPLLSRQVSSPAAERVFLLGDAAGYIEPFTGEGMAWALTSAIAVAPLALRAAHVSAQPMAGGKLRSLAGQWSLIHRQMVTRRQWVCRGAANLLRHPALVRIVLTAVSRLPVLAVPLIRYLNCPAKVH
jgi:flavin-dependent dehydrogenase